MRTIRLLAFPQANLLDVTGPLQVFSSASDYAINLGEAPGHSYEISLVSMAGGPVRTSAHVTIDTERADLRQVDTLLIAGGHGADAARADPRTIDWIRRQSALARRTGSICTGALLLAQAGLLSGRRATTHWGYCEALALEFPDVILAPDTVYVEDGAFWTSAGVLAGVDMAMAMVERDLGSRLADYTARALVATLRRAVGEPQVSARLAAQGVEGARIGKLMEWIAYNPRADLSAEALADRACLSVRSLQRRFVRESGETPAAFVERARVDFARRLLAMTEDKLERVAAASGFASVSAMQRAFGRVLGVPPGQYRKEISSRPALGAIRRELDAPRAIKTEG